MGLFIEFHFQVFVTIRFWARYGPPFMRRLVKLGCTPIVARFHGGKGACRTIALEYVVFVHAGELSKRVDHPLVRGRW